MKRAGATLVEALAYAAILSGTLGVCIALILTGVRWQERTERMLDMHQHTRHLRDVWREAIGQAELSTWSESSGALSSGNLTVTTTNDALVVMAGAEEVTRVFVPRGMSCGFAIETSDSGSCAVLSMTWVTQDRYLPRTNRVRAVALGALE